MSMTPEGRVKLRVKGILAQYPRMYYYMPVPTGYGQTSLDFIGCYNGLYFAIETKSQGKRPTTKQRVTIEDIVEAGGMVFVIAGLDDESYAPLISWLTTHRPTSHDPASAHQSPA